MPAAAPGSLRRGALTPANARFRGQEKKIIGTQRPVGLIGADCADPDISSERPIGIRITGPSLCAAIRRRGPSKPNVTHFGWSLGDLGECDVGNIAPRHQRVARRGLLHSIKPVGMDRTGFIQWRVRAKATSTRKTYFPRCGPWGNCN